MADFQGAFIGACGWQVGARLNAGTHIFRHLKEQQGYLSLLGEIT